MGAAPGFHGDNVPHILTYDPQKVGMWQASCAWFFNPDLTVFDRWKILVHIRQLVYAIVLMFIFGQDCFYPDSGGCPTKLVNKQVCQLVDELSDAKPDFRFLVGFVLAGVCVQNAFTYDQLLSACSHSLNKCSMTSVRAGFVARSITFWATRRTNYASLCGNTRNLTLQIASLVPIDPKDPTLMETRERLGRWIILAYELAMLKARGHMDSPEGEAHLTRAGLVADGEWAAMVGGDRHTTVFWWIGTELARLADSNILSEERLVTLLRSVGSMRGQANDVRSPAQPGLRPRPCALPPHGLVRSSRRVPRAAHVVARP